MNRNIKAELARNDMHMQDLANVLGLSVVSISSKVNGRRDWQLKEAKKVLDFFNSKGADYTLETLFF